MRESVSPGACPNSGLVVGPIPMTPMRAILTSRESIANINYLSAETRKRGVKSLSAYGSVKICKIATIASAFQ